MEQQVACFIEMDGANAGQFDAPRRADSFHCRINGRRIDRCRLIARQPQQHSPIGSVAQAGQRE